MAFCFLQARRQISALLKEGKASTQQGQGQHALQLLKQVLSDPPQSVVSEISQTSLKGASRSVPKL